MLILRFYRFYLTKHRKLPIYIFNRFQVKLLKRSNSHQYCNWNSSTIGSSNKFKNENTNASHKQSELFRSISLIQFDASICRFFQSVRNIIISSIRRVNRKAKSICRLRNVFSTHSVNSYTSPNTWKSNQNDLNKKVAVACVSEKEEKYTCVHIHLTRTTHRTPSKKLIRRFLSTFNNEIGMRHLHRQTSNVKTCTSWDSTISHQDLVLIPHATHRHMLNRNNKNRITRVSE